MTTTTSHLSPRIRDVVEGIEASGGTVEIITEDHEGSYGLPPSTTTWVNATWGTEGNGLNTRTMMIGWVKYDGGRTKLLCGFDRGYTYGGNPDRKLRTYRDVALAIRMNERY